MLHPKETHLALVPSTVLAFLGRTVFELNAQKPTEFISSCLGIWRIKAVSLGNNGKTFPSESSHHLCSERRWWWWWCSPDVRDALRDVRLIHSGQVFSFLFPALLGRHRSWGGGGGCCSCVSTAAGRRGFISEESPSDISEVASVLEDDHVDLVVEHGRDGEGLSFTGLREQNRCHNLFWRNNYRKRVL